MEQMPKMAVQLLSLEVLKTQQDKALNSLMGSHK